MGLIDQDRCERERKWINYIIATIFGGGVVIPLACGGLLVMLWTGAGESTPHEAKRWFKTVVHEDLSPFTDIQHYTDQGIDFSHHFRFRFANLENLTPIIKHHGLTSTQSIEPMQLDGLPDWYDPYSVPDEAPRFGGGGAEPRLLIVDPNTKIAYFELVHL